MVSISKQPPVLSVIIVAFKSRDEIGPCLEALPPVLLGRDTEVLVIDNSPGEGTAEIVANFAHVKYIAPPENLGFGRANNLGYSQSKGENILFLNPDTVCDSVALESCLTRILTEREIGLISPRLVLLDGSLDLACRRSIPSLWDGFCRASGLAAAFPHSRCCAGYNLSYLPVDGTYEVGAINGAFMMGRRDVFDKVGTFDEQFFMYGDDLDLCIRVGRAGYRIVYDGRVQITHIKGQSVAKAYDSMSTAIFDANRDVYLKHFNPADSLWIRWKYTLAFGLWKRVARLRAKLKKYRGVRPI